MIILLVRIEIVVKEKKWDSSAFRRSTKTMNFKDVIYLIVLIDCISDTCSLGRYRSWFAVLLSQSRIMSITHGWLIFLESGNDT